MGTDNLKRDILISRLDGIENENYDGLSDFGSFYLLSELKQIKKNVSSPFKYENLEVPCKEFKSIDDQIALLRSRNLKFSNENKAKDLLKECQYYRIMAYRYPFVYPENKDKFKDGVDFNDIWNLYIFDRRLRFIVIDAIERIEVSLRSRWAHVLSGKYGILAYKDNSVFDNQMIRKTLAKVLIENIQQSEQPCITHYLENRQQIPIWALCEVLTYGELLLMLHSIKPRSIKNEIFEGLGLDEKIISSFLNALRFVRNICAHHGRLWNKRLFKNFKCPLNPKELSASMNYPAIDEILDPEQVRNDKLNKQKSIYNILVMLMYLVEKIAPQSHWRSRLIGFIASDYASKFLSGMGFPDDWKSRPIWASFLKGK